MQCISFSGVDGSGKSTQLGLLKAKLEQEGKKVFYFHAVEFSLANKIARFFKRQKDFTPGQEKASTKASWFFLHVRIEFLFVDMVRFWFLRRRLESEKYDYLLSDRFFYDSIINIEYLTEKVSFFPWTLWLGTTILSKWMPKADKAYYFDIDPDTVMARDRAPEQGKDYLVSKINLFKQKIGLWHMYVINANGEKETISEEVINTINTK